LPKKKKRKKQFAHQLAILKKRIKNTQNILADGKVKDEQFAFNMLRDFRTEGGRIRKEAQQN